jgi:ATP-dependent helicase HepA
MEESAYYKKVAQVADRILNKREPRKKTSAALKRLFPIDGELHKKAKEFQKGTPGAEELLVQDLVDRHGTGRIVYRNRRTVVKGFPKRRLVQVKLEPDSAYQEKYDRLLHCLDWEEESLFFDPFSLTPSNIKLDQREGSELLKSLWSDDPRLKWLVKFLKTLPKSEKLLLICGSLGKVLALQEILPVITGMRFTVFHENLPLNLRDRNAADFSRPEGVRMMICSEIGSEGRNFQFTHRLVLWDLPLSPGLLEQRIGRLHRIGQKREVIIYVLYTPDSPSEVLFNWYHRGLDAFSGPAAGSEYVSSSQKTKLGKIAGSTLSKEPPSKRWRALLEGLVSETRKEISRIGRLLEAGRDRLLEINSFQAAQARKLIKKIEEAEKPPELEDYIERVCEVYGIDFNPTVEERGYIIFPGQEMALDAFPGLPEAGLTVTFDREQALIREDMAFLSWDHPLVTGAMDLVLGSPENTVCVAEWTGASQGGLLADLIFVLEPIRSPEFNLDRYLPPTPIRILIDRKKKLRNDLLTLLNSVHLKRGSSQWLKEITDFRSTQFPGIMQKGQQIAEKSAAEIRRTCLLKAEKEFNKEYKRFYSLGEMNQSFSSGALDKAERIKKEMKAVSESIKNAELRLDSLRFIVMTL